MNRNKGADYFRASMLLIMMLYHCWVLTGSWHFQSSVIQLFVMLGGEIGVTGFFLLSGYGIYYSIGKTKLYNKFDYIGYIKRRVLRICPEYYLMIFIFVLVSDASYLSDGGMKNIVTHVFFIHNLFPQWHGSINGALWTMGVIVQFYLVAPMLYKLMKKYGICFLIMSIIFTIVCKVYVYAYWLPYIGRTGEWEFVMGRQLFTALDNFSVGMFVAHLTFNDQRDLKKSVLAIASVTSIFFLFCVLKFGVKFGIHTDNLSGYTWHTALAISLGFLLWNMSKMKIEDDFFSIALQWISKYEYGIYLWHMIVLNNLLSKSEWVKKILLQESKLIYIPLLMSSVLVGYVCSIMVESALKIYHMNCGTK